MDYWTDMTEVGHAVLDPARGAESGMAEPDTTVLAFDARQTELPLADIAAFPNLATALKVWEQTAEGGLPDRLDVVDLPRRLLPYVMLLDLEEDVLRVRLAGTRVCDLHGGELAGKTTDTFFMPDQARSVVVGAQTVVSTGRPSLMRRTYVALDGRYWSYVRLLLPLAPRPSGVPSLFKAAEPNTLKSIGSTDYPLRLQYGGHSLTAFRSRRRA